MIVPKKVLVRSPNWIGDQVLAYPFFHYLREIYPHAKIGVICVKWVQTLQFKNLIDEIYTLPPMSGTRWISKIIAFEKIAQQIRHNGPWDLGITLPNSFSAAWILFRAGAKVRRGYDTDLRGFLLTERMNWEAHRNKHRSDIYIQLLFNQFNVSPYLGRRFPSAKTFWGEPEGVLSNFDYKKAWLDDEQDENLLEPPSPALGPYWILAPGSTAESRRWPLERWAALARLIRNETGWTGVIIGGGAEQGGAQKLSADPLLGLLDWTGRGKASSYSEVFKKAQFAVCNDSGLAHVASLLGCSVQLIWGAGNPQITPPIGPGKVKMIFNPIECWPCERNYCIQQGEQNLACLKGIYPEAVWKEIQNGIRNS